tara:strand:+ start:36 stop:701 length:666 start_codon:yes stop_codon:yes gene_type:complete
LATLDQSASPKSNRKDAISAWTQVRTRAVFSAAALGITAEQLAAEVRDLVHRGHRLGIPGCSCLASGSAARSQQLGIVMTGPTLCATAQLARSTFSHEEVACEILASSLEHPVLSGRSVLEVLAQTGEFVLERDAVTLARHARVHDAATLLAMVHRHPFGVNCNNAALQYATVHRDIEELRQAGQLIVREGALGVKRLWAVRVAQRPVSAALRELWFRSFA